MMRGAGLFLLSTIFFAAELRAVEMAPTLNLDILAGQVLFKDAAQKSTTFAGVGDWLGSLGLKLSDTDVLIPTVSGQFLDRPQVPQVGGGGRVTNRTLDNSISLRELHTINEQWEIKPTVSFKNESVTLESGERLGYGIFDYNELAVGVEVERKGETLKSLRQGIYFARDIYTHFQPSGSPLPGQELLESREALNFNSYDYSIEAELAFWDHGLVTAAGHGSYRDFTAQKVLESNGSQSGGRHDLFGAMVLGVEQEIPSSALPGSWEAKTGLNAGYFLLDSNQNDTSVVTSQFSPDYYSYREFSMGPWLRATLNRKFSATFSYTFAQRNYLGRPTQDASGAIGAGGLHVRTLTHTASLALSYPIVKGFSVKALGSYVSTSSNTDYEGGYLYDYSYAYYFMGVGYTF